MRSWISVAVSVLSLVAAIDAAAMSNLAVYYVSLIQPTKILFAVSTGPDSFLIHFHRDKVPVRLVLHTSASSPPWISLTLASSIFSPNKVSQGTLDRISETSVEVEPTPSMANRQISCPSARNSPRTFHYARPPAKRSSSPLVAMPLTLSSSPPTLPPKPLPIFSGAPLDRSLTNGRKLETLARLGIMLSTVSTSTLSTMEDLVCCRPWYSSSYSQ